MLNIEYVNLQYEYPVFNVIPHSLFEPTSYRTGVKQYLELFLEKAHIRILEFLQ